MSDTPKISVENHVQYPDDQPFTVSPKVVGRHGMQYGNDDRGIGVRMQAGRWSDTIRLDTVNALASTLLAVAMSGGDYSQAKDIHIEQRGSVTFTKEGAYFYAYDYSGDYGDESAFLPLTPQRYADLLLDLLTARTNLLQQY